MSQDISAVVEMNDMQIKWTEHNFWRDWDEALGASEAALPQGDMRRNVRNSPGHYGVERWGSSAEGAPYGHISCVDPHEPGAYASGERDEVGTPWVHSEGRYHGCRRQERSQEVYRLVWEKGGGESSTSTSATGQFCCDCGTRTFGGRTCRCRSGSAAEMALPADPWCSLCFQGGHWANNCPGRNAGRRNSQG